MLRLALLSTALLTLTACASRQPPPPPPLMADGYGGVVIDEAPLPFDPALLPPNTAPGDCLARTPDSWLRVPCAPAYAQNPYAQNAYAQNAYAGGYQSAYRTGYQTDYRYDDRAAYPTGYPPAGYGYYRAAGRDAEGYLVWPGKTPR